MNLMKSYLLAAAAALAVTGHAGELGSGADRFGRLDTYVQGLIERGAYAGAVTYIAHNGKLVQLRAYGHADVARRRVMAPDAIFRIYSMSKTITTVAVLTLMEEGKIGLDDPVENYLPEFKGIAVFSGGTADAPRLRAPNSPPTIRQLLTHTAGFAVYGKRSDPVNTIFDRAQLGNSRNLEQYTTLLSKLPLAHEPGAQFHYDGVGMQPLARLVERISGMPFDRYLQRRIFTPLGMVDTGFTVPLQDRQRIVEMSSTSIDGKLVSAGMLAAPGERMNPYLSGAGGLYSTVIDYGRFAQMLLNGGTLDGISILGRHSVELMMQNHLAQMDPPEIGPGLGFGLGGSVLLDPLRSGRPGSLGQFGWSGAGGTYFMIDPHEKLLALLMLQHLPQDLPLDPPKPALKFYTLVYQALAPQ